MRTVEEIIKRIADSRETDVFGFGFEVLACYLSFDDCKQFLRPDVNGKNWPPADSRAPEDIKKALSDYMAFAWAKVEDHRGLSAARSVIKMREWVWMLGDDALIVKIDAAPYPQYGAPVLKVVCEAMGLPMPDKETLRNMMAGQSCKVDCNMGCEQGIMGTGIVALGFEIDLTRSASKAN